LRISVSDDQRRLIGNGFSKTLVAVWSEKRISIIGFEKGKPLNLRCACHGRSLAHNHSLLRNGHLDTSIRISRASGRPTSKSNFPVFRSAATQTPIQALLKPVADAEDELYGSQEVGETGISAFEIDGELVLGINGAGYGALR
jgi:hypothetical protein